MVEVTNETTGEVLSISGDLMIASNGRAFIKYNGKTVFSSGSLDYTFATKETKLNKQVILCQNQ